MAAIDPKYDAILASLRERGLDDLAAQLINVATTPDQNTTTTALTDNPTQHQSSTQSDQISLQIQHQLELDLVDFSHLPTPYIPQPDQVKNNAFLNFSSEARCPFTSYITAITPCGKQIALFDGVSIHVFWTDDFFSSPPTPPIQRNNQLNSQTHTSGLSHKPRTLSMWTLPSQQFLVRSMKWSPVENTLLVLCNNSTILLYSVGHPIPLLIRDLDDISCFDVHPTGKFLILASRETPLIKLYDLTSFTSSIPFHAHSLCTKTPGTPTTQYLHDTLTNNANTQGQSNNTHNDNDHHNDEPHGGSQSGATHGTGDRRGVNIPPNAIHSSQLHVIQSTNLPQFPVYDIKYSHFAQFFAVLTMSPHISTNLPVLQVKIYNTTDHSLVNTFNLPSLQPLMSELGTITQHDSPLNTIDTHHNGTSSSGGNSGSGGGGGSNIAHPNLDPSVCPITLSWSPNDRFLLITTPFQPLFPTIPTTSYLYNIHDGSLLLTYTPIAAHLRHPLPSSTSTSMSKHQPTATPGAILGKYYTGSKSFFSYDSQFIFVISPASANMPGVVNDLDSIISIFRTVNGSKVDITEYHFGDSNNFEDELNNILDSNAASDSQANGNDMNNTDDMMNNNKNNNNNIGTTRSQFGNDRYKPIALPTSIIHDSGKSTFYISCHNNSVYQIDYHIQ